MHVTTGVPSHRASVAVVCALYGSVSRKKIAKLASRQMIGQVDRPRKHQAFGSNASRLGFGAKVLDCGIV